MDLPENEKLTPEEKAYLVKYVRNIERNNRFWPIVRWFLLCVPLLLFTASVLNYNFYISTCVPPVEKDLKSIFLDKKSYTTPVTRFDLESQRLTILNSIESGNVSVLRFFLGLMEFGLGCFVLTLNLVMWNRHLRQGTMNKIYRRFLRENSAADETYLPLK